MNDRKISYLLYCSSGLILSILLVLLFEAYHTIRFLSDGGVVFGVICAIFFVACS
jgi:hypothetical protein